MTPQEHALRFTGASLEPYPRLAQWFGRIVRATVYLAVFLVPAIVLPLQINSLEFPKQNLLIVLAIVGLVAWTAEAMCLRRMSMSRSWVHLVVLVFLAGYGVISWFSLDRYASFIGNQGQVSWSFVTIASLVALYFLTVHTIRDTATLYHLVLTYLTSSVLIGLAAFLFMTGLFPGGKTINAIGTVQGLALYLTVPMLLASSLMVLGCKNAVCVIGGITRWGYVAKALVWAAIAMPLIIDVVVDSWFIWITVLFGTGLLVMVSLARMRRVHHPMQVIIPVMIAALAFIMILIRTPLSLNLPAEVSPSFSASWNIARQALQERPLVGTGPGTWIYDYAKYRSAAVNMTTFWSVRFDRALSHVLTLVASTGLIGIALWLILVASGIIKSIRHLLAERNDDLWQAYLAVFVPWATLLFIAFIYNYTVAFQLAFWFLLALLAALFSPGEIVWNVRKSAWSGAALSLIMLVAILGGVSTLWLIGQRMAAEVVFAQALDGYRASQSLDSVTNNLRIASGLNPHVDAYSRNLSQAYLLAASRELQSAHDTETSKRINADVSLSLEQAKYATQLSPLNVDNWANIAMMLQTIAPVTRGADEQAIRAYQEALKHEPNNPVYWNEIAKIRILRADAYRQLLQSKDEAVKKDAIKQGVSELEQAAEALNQALQAKPDFAPAHYNLGLVYERQGRVKDAIVKLERTLESNPRDIGVAFQLSILYYRNNEKDKAMNVLEQIVAFDSTYINARWYLASMYEERGRIDDAIVQLQKVRELAPDNTTVSTRLKDLISQRNQRKRQALNPLPEPVREEIKSPSDDVQIKK